MGDVGRQTPARNVTESKVNPVRQLTRILVAVMLAASVPLLAACGLANREGTRSAGSTASTPAQANPGEREGSAPPQRQAAPPAPATSPQSAVERFADGYINWSYQTLAADEQHLAASAVGEARASELQARQQTERDSALARGHVFNTGTVVTVALVKGAGGNVWACVTKEQTGGEGEYTELAAAYHVTLATVARVPGGWSVRSWRPEL
jgi:hypothetical protein